MGLLADVLDHLEAAGLVGGASGWARAAGYLPPTPDRVIAVFETPGPPPEVVKAGSTEPAYDAPRFQVRGRGAPFGYEALRARMEDVYLALHDSTLSPATGDPAYVRVDALQSGPLSLGLDENSRPGLTWNFETLRERES